MSSIDHDVAGLNTRVALLERAVARQDGTLLFLGLFGCALGVWSWLS